METRHDPVFKREPINPENGLLSLYDVWYAKLLITGLEVQIILSIYSRQEFTF